MTDLVAQLVGALDRLALAVDVAEDGCTHGGFGPGYENGHGIECGALIQAARAEARAALSAAKDGGWVAVPVEPTPEMIHEVEHAARLGAVWTAESVYKAMLAARPLPNPPKGEV